MKEALPPMNHDIAARHGEIADVCAQLGIRRLEQFGSAARGEPAHDLDFLVNWATVRLPNMREPILPCVSG